MGRILDYADLTMIEMDSLDRSRTVFLLALGPMEAHGPHLPLGMDLFVAQEMLERYINLLQERHPELDLVRLPPLTLGADILPRTGSVSIPPRVLERVLGSYVANLASEGFRYLFVADNHGGPRHLLACEAAARRAHRRHEFHLVNPFCHEFALMMSNSSILLEGTGLRSGTCGDIEDLHAGTNETSLALAISGDLPRADYCQLPALRPPPPDPIFRLLAGLLRSIGAKGLAREILDLGSIIHWAGDNDTGSYIGSPAAASAAKGEIMLQKRLQLAAELFERVLSGQTVALRPPLWPLKFLRLLPMA